jgi:hypothetical protein
LAALNRDAGPADAVAVEHASAITAALRQERSSKKLGFGVPVRATLGLTRDHEAHWPAIHRDILAGNNVVSADVSFHAAAIEAAIAPQPADA